MTTPTLHHVDCPLPAGTHPRRASLAAPQQHRMAYWEWNQTGDLHHPHVVVCVHGLSRQGRDFDVLAQALSSHARVICPDVVGRGQSDWLADPMGYQLPVYAQDMLTLLQHLQAQAPIRTLDWVGTSMGGLIGMALFGQDAFALPVPLHRLVLNDVGPRIEWQALSRIGQYLGNLPVFDNTQAATQVLWAISQSFGPHTPAQWQALSAPMLQPLPDGRVTLHYDPAIAVPYRAMQEADAPAGEALLWQLYDRLQAPTLLLRGGDSDLLSAQTAQEMGERGPRAKCLEFAGVGHAPTLVAADQVAAVKAFLLEGVTESLE